MNQATPDLVPFSIPRHPQSISLAQARVDLPREEFRLRLRKHMIDHPGLTLAQVGRELRLSRQRIALIVGRLDRPNCAAPGPRPAPKRDEAARRMLELELKVMQGSSAEAAARELGLSLAMAMRLGFRVHSVKPPHGTQARLTAGCRCWRCRQAGGISLPRGPRTGPVRKAAVLDWLAYRDPDDGSQLKQIDIAKLAGVAQGAVSRIARAAGGAE
jgi:hypothetical protein